ncbi:tRNA lysidine(34) synthetase TilS [Actinomyces sp. B33]|uniref:tRNA lysidine(34) synthetase TilS n=1 Tax=Actinomyces sp. B33 TaxID=2942131 RepID=UPI00233FBAFE|nr:tRNA lysidine(34) synthetase TilS [Actinomyces sp. B33]MDC4233515.1 tRNA lysidine(34) synthetase TilS [Actinomyces sp. B33]
MSPDGAPGARPRTATEASRLVGARPSGPLARISLAVRRALVSSRRPPACVLVGVSGGADSLSLALAAIDVGSRNGVPVHCLTVDHGLRPDSAEEARRVADLLVRLGADSARTAPVRVDSAGGPEAAARFARRHALAARAADLSDGTAVLLGHTMDDQAETVLLRLARGSGTGSLRAMSPDAVDEEGLRWIRPLLGVRRADTREACRQAGLAWVDDPTNLPDGPWRAADGTALRRAAVRARALPALADALGVDPVPALARTAALAARDDDALDALAGAAWRTAVDADPAGAPVVPVADLAGLPPAVLSRVLRRMLLVAGARPSDLSAAHIDRARDLVSDWHGQGPVDAPGARLAREGHGSGARLVARRAPAPPPVRPA